MRLQTLNAQWLTPNEQFKRRELDVERWMLGVERLTRLATKGALP